MRRLAIALALAFCCAADAAAVEPEACLVPPGAAAVASVEYAGKIYELASIECRELFLTDPERYSQLFDALAQMGASAEAEPIEEPSLVPN